MQTIARLEKTISSNIDSLRTEVRADLAELKNAINEIQSNLNTLTARINETEDWISYVEEKLIEKRDQEEVWNKQLRSHENRIREINDTMKCSKVRIMGIPEGVEKEKRLEDIVNKFWMKISPNWGMEQMFMS